MHTHPYTTHTHAHPSYPPFSTLGVPINATHIHTHQHTPFISSSFVLFWFYHCSKHTYLPQSEECRGVKQRASRENEENAERDREKREEEKGVGERRYVERERTHSQVILSHPTFSLSSTPSLSLSLSLTHCTPLLLKAATPPHHQCIPSNCSLHIHP